MNIRKPIDCIIFGNKMDWLQTYHMNFVVQEIFYVYSFIRSSDCDFLSSILFFLNYYFDKAS